MPKLPDALSNYGLGQRPTPQPQRGVYGYKTGAIEDAALYSAEKMGQAADKVNKLYDEKHDEFVKLQLAQAQSALYLARADAIDQVSKDPDYENAPQKYEELMNKAKSQIAFGMDSDHSRQLFEASAGLHIAEGLAHANTIRRDKQEKAGLASVLTTADNNKNLYLAAQTDEDRQKILDNTGTLFNTARDSGFLDPVEAFKLKRTWGQDVVEARLNAQPPAERVRLLQPLMDKMQGKTSDANGPPEQLLPGATNAPSEAATSINFVMTQLEGKAFVPNDGGRGPSKFGIVGKDNGLTPEQVAGLTSDKAAEIYKTKYWDEVGADKLPPNMRLLAFDTAVNFGQDTAKQMIAESGNDPQKLLQIRQQKYQELAAQNPEKYGKYAASWQNRNELLGKMVGDVGPKQGNWVDFIPLEKVPELYHKAQTETSVNYQENLLHYNDLAAALSDPSFKGNRTVPSMAEVADNVGEKQAPRVHRELAMAAQAGDIANQLTVASPKQAVELIKNIKPADGQVDGYATAAELQKKATEIYATQVKQLQDDPVAAVSKIPVVQDKLNAYTTAQDPVEKQKAFMSYIAASEAMQLQKTGGRADMVRVLSKSDADAIVGSINNAFTNRQDVFGMMVKLRQQYGQYWPRAVQDLINDKLPPPAIALSMMDSPGQIPAAKMLSEALVDKEKSVTELMKDSEKDLNANVDSYIEDYVATTGRQYGGNVVAGAVRDATKILAATYMRHYGIGVGDALKRASDDIVNNEYNYGPTFRVPKTFNARAVQNGGDYVLSNLKPEDIIVQHPTVGDAATQSKAYYEKLKRTGQWVNNPDDTGLTLLDEDGNYVLRRDGSPLQFGYKDLAEKNLDEIQRKYNGWKQ